MPCLTRPLDNIGRPIIQVIVKPSTLYRVASGLLDKNWKQVSALIDTGASMTCIDENLAIELGLQSKGPATSHGIGGTHTSNQFDVDIIFPLTGYTYSINNYLVRDCKIKNQGIDMLIGMDIIAKGGLMFNQNLGFTFCL